MANAFAGIAADITSAGVGTHTLTQADYPLNSTPVLAIDTSRMWGNALAQLWTDDAAVFLLPQYQAIVWTGSVTFTDSGSITMAASVIGYAWKISPTWARCPRVL